MRLLIYLLALLSGVNAAEAARPASVEPSAAQASAFAVVQIVEAENQAIATWTAVNATPRLIEAAVASQAFQGFSFAMLTPVTRSDIICQ
jgi:hypothetical protein